MSQPGTLAVVGLGYVGLPLAREACLGGWRVFGWDNNDQVISILSTGKSHLEDIRAADIQDMLSRGFQPTTEDAVLREADVVVICVPTPLTRDGGPDLAAVSAAGSSVAQHLQAGQLVVLESTTYPGTTEEVLIPVLETSGKEAGKDFFVAFSPERIDPGNSAFGVRNTPKVVGGLSSNCTRHAVAFYESFIDTVVVAKGLREAEMSKLLENTYRHVNIALVNEMARFSHLLDIDFWDAIRCASTKPFGFQPFFPGPGVGGHCIPIDPNYLSHRVRSSLGQPFKFVELAQEINSGMPEYVVKRAQEMLNRGGLPVKGSRVLLVGITYKADVSDQRESPAVAIATALRELDADLTYLDPYVPEWSPSGIPVARSTDLPSALKECDLAIFLQHHNCVDTTPVANVPTRILDTRGVLYGSTVETL